MNDESHDNAAKIAQRNDEFREAILTSTVSLRLDGETIHLMRVLDGKVPAGKLMLTAGVRESGRLGDILAKVRAFRDFTEDTDPYGEHDFGNGHVGGEKVFWKIDYYDPTLSQWEDPLSPDCHRVLTVMLADEY